MSSLQQYFAPVDSQGFAIKYVKEGTERYCINDEEYKVESGQYLVLNGQKNGSVLVDTNRNTKGICLNISQAFVEEVISFRRNPESNYADPALSAFLYSNEFLHNCYDTNNRLGQLLQSIATRVESEELIKSDINDEFFLQLAEAIVDDQQIVYKQLQDIPVVKNSAKQDLYRRIQKGKEYIDQYFTTDINTESIAREAAMSQFHFLRLFKTVYKLSPYQYILNKRLDFAKMLLNDRETVSNSALESGFSDVYSFSKAFKRKFGISPSQVSRLK